MKKRLISLVLALVMCLSLVPTLAFADGHDGQVRVIVENTTYPVADGAPWEGTLVDEWVEVNDDSTMMSCVVAALDNNGYEQSGAENNYISTINGLSEFDGGGMSGWMGTLNDWFTNYGFGDFTVAAGNFGAGDEIHIMYTCAYGDDLGGSWSNTDTRIDSIKFSAGSLNKDFSPESDAYTLTLPAGTTEVNVQPTAANKNYMVRIFLNDFEEGAETHYGTYEYKRNDLIPVKNGDTIYVGCGLAQWPSMNESDGGHKYAFKVVIPEAEQKADYKTVLNNTLAQLAVTVSNPTFGTGGGEWSVLSLARGGYFAIDDPYFETYYSNVEKTVPGLAETAAGKGVKEGGLDKNKSTENSRLILALAAIDKDPTNVGGVNVLGAYDANGFNWIKKQGINGPIFALIALDTRNYPTTDTTLRQQCVDFILGKEVENGGWALSGTAADPDITSMALQALVKYKDQKEVAEAAGRAFTALSNMQQDNGGFASWGSVNSESIAQVITALSAWGIDADKDSRFVKNGSSALDALLTFYVPEGKGFAHVLTSGGGYTGGEVNGMATDQAAYALVAYDRFKSGKTALYDMADVQHTFGDWTVTESASCTKDGSRSHVCSVCGKTETEKIAKLEHKMTKTAAKAATCIAEGNNEYYTCSVCKKVFKDAAGKTETTAAAETLPLTDHNWQNATCTVPEICRECGKTRGETAAHKYDTNGICTVCGGKNPIAAVKVDEVKQADTVGGKTVSSENSGKIVADNSGLVVKTSEAVTPEKLTEIKEALKKGSTVIKKDAANTKEIPSTSTDAEELTALASTLSGEQKEEVEKLAEKLTSMQTDSTRKNQKVELVLDLSVSLKNTSGTDLAELTELPAPITVTIPISNKMYQRLQGKTVAILRSHTDVSGDVVVSELAATLGGTEDDYFVQFASDKFSTFALTSYEKVSSGHHGGTVTPVSVKSAPTGDAGVVLYIAVGAMSCIGSTALLRKRNEEA